MLNDPNFNENIDNNNEKDLINNLIENIDEILILLSKILMSKEKRKKAKEIIKRI